MQRTFRIALSLIAAFVILLSCSSERNVAALAIDDSSESLADLPISEEYNGMGGVDTVFANSQLEGFFEQAKAIPDLYYELYTVQDGDIILDIANRFGVSQDAIITLNNLRSTRTMRVGQILKIPSIDGILYTAQNGDTPESIANQYRVSLEKIAIVNNMADNRIEVGARIFLPDARLDSETLLEINGEHFSNPIRASYYITSNYGWRNNPFSGNRTFHNGVDMACPTGTSVYATMAGDVIATGYSPTYGNYVKIRHHSGYESMYAHMSQILTSAGSYVTSKTCIGLVGNTGKSTGPHLHFTVLKNNSSTNPTLLWD